jgi:hypothetical protein
VEDQGQPYEAKNSERNRSNDRLIVLKQIEGKAPMNSIGMVDKRLFDGKNRLHCISDEQTGLWSLKFEHGLIPGSLDQQFTSFGKALTKVKEYYDRRNVEVSEVID